MDHLTEAQQRLFIEGVRLFNEQAFFQCHEVLEEAWVEASGETKLFLQAIIQTAVALYHMKRTNLVGARRLLHAAVSKLQQYPSSYLSIDVERLLADIVQLAAVLDTPGVEPTPPANIPTLHTA